MGSRRVKAKVLMSWRGRGRGREEGKVKGEGLEVSSTLPYDSEGRKRIDGLLIRTGLRDDTARER